MLRFEYRVVPAPAQAGKVKGLKSAAERYAHGLAETMNALGRDGWEYVRAESLPCEDKPGMLSRPVTTTVHLLVFRRPLPEPAAAQRQAAEPAAAPAPAAVPAAMPPPAPPAIAAPAAIPAAAGGPAAGPRPEPRPAAAVSDKVRLMPLGDRAAGGRGGLPRLGAATGRGLFRGPAARGDAAPQAPAPGDDARSD
ncbi:MAG: DUF4177 domain-containing protein [Rhodobacteraceae bacterium]|nr:DUF4177 domain-containing protein [Paracoccaceae bacterium]